jgi:hypothetical protein
MLNVIMLNVIMLNVIMLNVIMLNVIMLKVIMLNVVMLSAVAPLMLVPLPPLQILNVLFCYIGASISKTKKSFIRLVPGQILMMKESNTEQLVFVDDHGIVLAAVPENFISASVTLRENKLEPFQFTLKFVRKVKSLWFGTPR